MRITTVITTITTKMSTSVLEEFLLGGSVVAVVRAVVRDAAGSVVILHSSLKLLTVPGTVQLNFAVCIEVYRLSVPRCKQSSLYGSNHL